MMVPGFWGKMFFPGGRHISAGDNDIFWVTLDCCVGQARKSKRYFALQFASPIGWSAMLKHPTFSPAAGVRLRGRAVMQVAVAVVAAALAA